MNEITSKPMDTTGVNLSKYIDYPLLCSTLLFLFILSNIIV